MTIFARRNILYADLCHLSNSVADLLLDEIVLRMQRFIRLNMLRI